MLDDFRRDDLRMERAAVSLMLRPLGLEVGEDDGTAATAVELAETPVRLRWRRRWRSR